MISLDNLDSILLACLSSKHPSFSDPFDHLIKSYRRCQEERGLIVSSSQDDPRLVAVAKLLSAIVSYSGMYLQNPDIFMQSARSDQSHLLFLKYLESPSDAAGFPPQFLNDFAARFEDDGIDEILNPIMDAIFASLANVNIIESATSKIQVLTRLCSNKILCKKVSKHKHWLPSCSTGREVQTNTILGRLFSLAISPENALMAAQYFPEVTGLSKIQYDTTVLSIRQTCEALQQSLQGLIVVLVRNTKDSNYDAILDFVGAVANKNTERLKMNPNIQITSGDGFVLQLCGVLLRLAAPFVVQDPAKMDHVDLSYCHTTKRINFLDDNRIAVASDEYQEWHKKRYPGIASAILEKSASSQMGQASTQAGRGPPSFINECFHLALRILHVGFMSASQNYINTNRRASDARQQAGQLQAQLDAAANSPFAMVQRSQLEMIKKAADDLLRQNFVYEAVLLEPTAIQTSLRLYTELASRLFKMLNHDQRTPATQLPLPTPVPMEYATLPMHFIEDMAEYLLFCLRICPRLVFESTCDTIFELFVLLIGSPAQVKNPYVRDKMAQCLHAFVTQIEHHSFSPLAAFFDVNNIPRHFLINSLITIYIDIEFTGAHSQFYDKFSTRHSLSKIFDHLWANQHYRNSFNHEFGRDKAKFIKFLTLLINDQNYLLDEAISQLHTIRTIELEMEDQDSFNRLPQQARAEKQQALAQSTRIVKSYLLLADSTLTLLAHLASYIIEPFMGPEMVDRMASVLDYYLVRFAGPKVQELKVKEPSRFNFDPKRLLTLLCQVYLHLTQDRRFLEAVVRDERSCNPTIFRKATSILRRHLLLDSFEIDALDSFVSRVEEACARKVTEEEELGEVPDDFCDPITAVLMKDPVILPTSGQTMDRSTIETHLRNDEKDPFNRKHLTADMLQPNVELKKQIDEWLASKKRGN
eukprot:TRINITY_DN2939_c0_g1_i3.p1 TRINITY_DN2939_c0_g1~~TRINITY_DN2939_c0_g1_i3.p1  ORF type:complete len:928 (+),score=199.42 TRINITY_DN2939_c0_g1_i3:675-3458(+)